ncbi:fatty acid desaturase family protein [Streptomyces sp. NPDC093221]|uniref:fatty acid desaturase family protein n=1 Tax=Streptomyces sp. NPDC093221 TaxID=3366032 RepID=UPI003800D78E
MDFAVRVALMSAGYVLVLAFARSPFVSPGGIAWFGGITLFALASVSMVGSWFHDAVHGNVRGGRWRSEAVLRAGSAAIGLGPRWWFHKHVRLHHRYVGNPAFDPDIQFGWFGRVTAEQPWHALHRAQHLYMWLLLPFSTLNMLKPSELWTTRQAVVRRVVGPRGRGWPWFLLADKYLPHAVVWIPVFLVLPTRRALLTYLLFHLISGTFVSLITQVQHNTDLAEYGPSVDGTESLSAQLSRSTDVGGGRGFWYWLSGGTTYHCVHHLAPTLTFPELPAATERLVALLAGTEMTVRTHPSMWAAVKSHGRLIRALSVPESGTGQSGTGQNCTGQNCTGQNCAGKNSAGQNPAPQDTAGHGGKL